MKKNAYMIIDGQWGSTGKGLLCGHLAMRRRPKTLVCNFGPNAGHTYVTSEDRKVVTCQLPTGIVSPSVRRVLIGPGAIIDMDLYAKEVKEFGDLLAGKQLFVHERAAVVTAHDQEAEKIGLDRISSTCKGTGSAQARKIMRCAELAGDHRIEFGKMGTRVVSTEEYQHLISVTVGLIQIESAQGFELGINSGSHYPHCTARDITPAQVMSDCQVPLGRLFETNVVCRTFPIRVGHSYDASGKKVGDSGPVYADQTELDWDRFEKLGYCPETTTVTGKIRRIFTWSVSSFAKMLNMIEPTNIFLNFANYMDQNELLDLMSFMSVTIEFSNSDAKVKWIGYGPKSSDIKETY